MKIPAGADLYGFFNLDMGMGQAARAAALALINAGVSVAVHPRFHDTQSASDTSLDKYASRDHKHPINIFFVNAIDTPQLEALFGDNVLSGKYNIGVWNWELEKLPQEWAGAFDYLDEIWAPSTFIYNAVKALNKTKKVTLMPYPVVVSDKPKLSKNTFALTNDIFYFLFVCDLNSYVDRKNPAGAISAFLKAFPPEQSDVGLVLKVHGKGIFWEARRLLLEAADQDRRIVLIDANLGRDAMESLHATCDAFVSLHRSEGYGLNLAESMWLGKPVIATRYSGNTDFMTDENSCLVDCKLVPVREGQYLLGQGQLWADPDLEQAAYYMRKLVSDRDFALSLGERAAASIQDRLSIANVGKVMRKRIDDILTEISD